MKILNHMHWQWFPEGMENLELESHGKVMEFEKIKSHGILSFFNNFWEWDDKFHRALDYVETICATFIPHMSHFK